MTGRNIRELAATLRGKPDADVLEGIAAIIEDDPDRWGRGFVFKSEEGESTYDASRAHSACAVGFADLVYPPDVLPEENRELTGRLLEPIAPKQEGRQSRYSAIKYNDTRRDVAEIIAWFRKAAEIARQEQTEPPDGTW